MVGLTACIFMMSISACSQKSRDLNAEDVPQSSRERPLSRYFCSVPEGRLMAVRRQRDVETVRQQSNSKRVFNIEGL